MSSVHDQRGGEMYCQKGKYILHLYPINSVDIYMHEISASPQGPMMHVCFKDEGPHFQFSYCMQLQDVAM